MRLLTYNTKKYLWLTSLLIVLSIPAFYFAVNSILLKATDSALKSQATLIPKYISEIKNPADLELWRKLDNNVEVALFDKNRFKKEPFTIHVINPETKDFQTYRYLQKETEIFGIKHTITFKVPLLEKKELLKSILIVQISLLLLIWVGFIIINSVSKNVWAPFNQIVDFLKSYELAKDKELTEEELEIDEFNDLKFAIKNLTERTKTSYQLQKEFTENAAHELQTPIAIIKSKLDLMLQDKSLSKNQSTLIDQIFYVLQKLSDLNKNLLFLTKLENQQFIFEDHVDGVATVSNVIENLNFFAEGKYQQLLFPRPEPVFFEGNQALVDQLVQNLMINAIQYSPKGSIINILLTHESLTFVNEGSKLDFNEERLFSRFSKTIEKDQKGNGLGLAICKKIALVHGFDISYRYQNSKHHFSVSFKQKNEA
ncbi:MAG TPA: HAMP domain-containing sensor histidine kinase [Pelobium sp.]|nr:HAMP domain-containing sensor histidine kinase [Pelobium sp.]